MVFSKPLSSLSFNGTISKMGWWPGIVKMVMGGGGEATTTRLGFFGIPQLIQPSLSLPQLQPSVCVVLSTHTPLTLSLCPYCAEAHEHPLKLRVS